MLAINSVPDHLHMLIGLKPEQALSDLMRDVKSISSKYMNENGWTPGRFSWQEGFGAFSHSQSKLHVVAEYIGRQQEHHRSISFSNEYRLILERREIDYNERHLFQP